MSKVRGTSNLSSVKLAPLKTRSILKTTTPVIPKVSLSSDACIHEFAHEPVEIDSKGGTCKRCGANEFLVLIHKACQVKDTDK